MFNNKKTFTKIIIAILLLNIVFLFNMNYTQADSGFDSSYDSGSSWDSGSSYGSSSGSYGGNFSFKGSLYFILATIGIVILNKYMKKKQIKSKDTYLTIIIILAYILGNILYGSDFFITIMFLGYFGFMAIVMPFMIISGSKKTKKFNTNPEDYFKHDSKFDTLNTEELQQKLFGIYKDIQLAWANNDISPVRNILSDELFNTYQMQIDSMIQTNQRNVMADIKFIKMVVGNDLITNNFEEIKVIMQVTCHDYIVENKNGKEKVIRGKSSIINDYIYAMTFVRNIKIKKPECPNCGTKLDNAMSSICPSCKSVVVHDSDNWVLSKKQMLRQTRR